MHASCRQGNTRESLPQAGRPYQTDTNGLISKVTSQSLQYLYVLAVRDIAKIAHSVV